MMINRKPRESTVQRLLMHPGWDGENEEDTVGGSRYVTIPVSRYVGPVYGRKFSSCFNDLLSRTPIFLLIW